MPTISYFYGITIVMYLRNKEHNPPHIHAITHDFAAPFLISNGEIIEGEFPAKAKAMVKEFVLKYIMTDIENKHLFYDSKTILQEVVQGEHEQLTYVLLEETGPDHDKSFTVGVLIGRKEISTGTGHTKKAAEQEAAYKALLVLKSTGKKGE